jgi:hypothetical protein
MRFVFAAALAVLLASCETAGEAPGEAAPAEPIAKGESRSFVLSGDLTRKDHQTYREIPFSVPRGVTSLTVELKYDNANRTVVDMGLRDPRGQRGWSGGNKSKFTISEYEATPSYFPGRIQPGTWTLVLGVPNIREASTAHFEATVTLDTAPVAQKSVSLSSTQTLNRQPGWKRGDFHMHTEHSDGSCDDGSGKRAPCPLWRSIVAARAAELDFIAITEHNTLSHRDVMRGLQPDFPSMLLILGTEITTFHGHANAVGLSQPLEFQLGTPRLPDTG